MKVVLSPDDGDALRKLYRVAFKEARELFVATAYLTHWDAQLTLNPRCGQVVFVVGTDFGITRKAALRDVLKWLPKHGTVVLGAVSGAATGGFHPKVLLWKTASGARKCIVGSSNLSKAGFDSNYEANIVVSLKGPDYDRLQSWISHVAGAAAAINEDWITHHYTEAKRAPTKATGALTAPVSLKLPIGHRYAQRVKERRKQQAAFKEIAQELRLAMRSCSSGELSNKRFWETFWRVWSPHESRFQGSGLQISGEAANWRQACTALLKVTEHGHAGSDTVRDHVVSLEIDRLSRASNPARGAWFSEMLCHFLPEHYPVLNGPVKRWLRANKWRARRGATEGQRYVELARQLRVAVRDKPAGATNLAELDLAIWQWVMDHR